MTAGDFANSSGRLALLVAVLIGLVLAWQSVQLVWLLAVGPEVESAPMPPVPRVQPAASGREGFRWDLFGETRSAPAVARPVQAARSNLRLRGLMSGGEDAFAIIADDGGTEAVYRSGDELPDGSRLESIEAMRVIITRNGEREALEMERGLRSPGVARVSAPRQSQPNQPVLPGIRGMSAVPTGVSAAALQQSGSSAAGLADQISVLPVAGGGFRVRPGRDATLFAELGLQVNDVVTAVNGQTLASEADARALFADVMRRGEVAITIQRQGREMTLRPDLAGILARIE